jgi:hypothetical protein
VEREGRERVLKGENGVEEGEGMRGLLRLCCYGVLHKFGWGGDVVGRATASRGD